MTIIAKLSFWIMRPKNKSIITRLSQSLKKMGPFEKLILDALDQVRTEGYVEKLKTSITQKSLPSDDDLLEFLCNQVAYCT